MVSTLNNRNSSVSTLFYSETVRLSQGVQTEKFVGQSVKNSQSAFGGNGSGTETFSAMLCRQMANCIESTSLGLDMTQTTRSQMMGWVNDEIKNGNMSLDQGFPFMAMSMKIPADGSSFSGLHNLDNSELINVPEMISKGIEEAERRGDQQTLGMLRTAQHTIQQNSNAVLTARESQQIAQMMQPKTEESLSLTDIAKKYDVTEMTPVEIDRMVKEMTDNNVAPLKELMMLSTYGAEFRAHLQEHARAAGVEEMSLVTTEYNSGMNEKKNILDIVYAQKEMAHKHGESTENYDRVTALLESMAAQHSAAMETQEAAGPSPYGRVQQSNRVNIDGIIVITSEHSLDSREGVSLLQTVSPTESKDIFSQLVSFADANDPNAEAPDESAAAQEGAPLMTVVESKALGPLPAGASSTYMDIDMFRPAGQWAEGPMLRPTNPGADDSFYRRRTEELMRVVGVERQLKAQYGNDIKLIYSHSDEDYIMLTPDDARYNEMNSAESSVQTIIDEVHRGFINEGAVSDILSKYGYTV